MHRTIKTRPHHLRDATRVVNAQPQAQLIERRPIVAESTEVEPEIEGDEVRLGPFAFTYDRAEGTLSGTLPASRWVM